MMISLSSGIMMSDPIPKIDDLELGKEYAQRFLATRSVLVFGEVNEYLAEKCVRQLLVLDQISEDPINVYIDSPGGSIDAGFAIFDTIRYINSPVSTIVMGLAASMGAMILLSTKKEVRFGLEHSRYLIHQPLSGISGVATDIEIHARELERYRLKINQIISKETGKDLKQVTKDTDRDFWLDANEAKDYGLISRVIQKKSDLSLLKVDKRTSK